MAQHPFEENAQALLGRVLDNRYRIDSLLGYGGMGLVFRGVQTAMQRPIAVKTLHPEFAMAPQFFERFRREAEVASRLHHPNIITVFDFGKTTDGLCYCVMEYLAGESLRQRVKAAGPLTLREAAAVTEQAAQGIGHAHKQSVVHRDIKPQNIMLAEVDGRQYVKVLDFGLVKAMQQDDEEQLTSTGQVLGTPQYMPPEQAGGDEVDQRSDIYSLTGVFYYCLTGRSPFNANTVGKALQAALTQQVDPVASLRVGAPVPEAIDAVIRKGLMPEKADRFQTVDELVEALHAALAGETDAVLDAVPEFSPDASRDGGSGAASSMRRATQAPLLMTKSVSSVEAPSSRGTPAPHAGAAPALGSAAPRRGSAFGVAVAVTVVALAVGGGLFAWWSARDPKPALPDPGAKPFVGAPATTGAVPGRPVTPPDQVDAPMKITLRTTPEGAEVLEGGATVGRTPLTVEWPRGAQRTLLFRLTGHVDLEKALKPATDADFDFSLEPLKVRNGTGVHKGPRKPKDDIGVFD
jgi:serine/threonine protein kinase